MMGNVDVHHEGMTGSDTLMASHGQLWSGFSFKTENHRNQEWQVRWVQCSTSHHFANTGLLRLNSTHPPSPCPNDSIRHSIEQCHPQRCGTAPSPKPAKANCGPCHPYAIPLFIHLCKQNDDLRSMGTKETWVKLFHFFTLANSAKIYQCKFAMPPWLFSRPLQNWSLWKGTCPPLVVRDLSLRLRLLISRKKHTYQHGTATTPSHFDGETRFDTYVMYHYIRTT